MQPKLFTTRLSAPLCLTWEITKACNLRCGHCLSSSGPSGSDDLSLAEAMHLIDDMADMGIFYVNLGGGEPFCRPDLFEIIEHSLKKDLPLQISTNGTLLTPDLVRRLAELPYLYLQVSLDGATAKVNDAIRGAGSYDRALGGMRLLAEEGLEFVVNCVMTRLNCPDLRGLSELASSFGATLRLSRLRPTGRAEGWWDSLHPTAEQYVYLYNWLRGHPDVLTGDSFFFLSALGEPVKGLGVCGAGRVTCAITPEGGVLPCPFLPTEPFLAGNVRERPLSEIWHESRVLQSFRDAPLLTCQDCSSMAECRGGCLAVKYGCHGSLDGCDPECVLPIRGKHLGACQ